MLWSFTTKHKILQRHRDWTWSYHKCTGHSIDNNTILRFSMRPSCLGACFEDKRQTWAIYIHLNQHNKTGIGGSLLQNLENNRWLTTFPFQTERWYSGLNLTKADYIPPANTFSSSQKSSFPILQTKNTITFWQLLEHPVPNLSVRNFFSRTLNHLKMRNTIQEGIDMSTYRISRTFEQHAPASTQKLNSQKP